MSKMDFSDLVVQRLQNQRLIGTGFVTPEDAVRFLGAVQAQDYTGAKWGVGQRVTDCLDGDVHTAYEEGRILRTHIMRPTWHFVLPEDIRWMQELTAPRVHAVSAYYYRKLELDDTTFVKAEAAIVKALQGNNHLTRTEIKKVLEDVDINADGLRLGYILMHAELSALICSGATKGKQRTHALLTERAPQATSLPRNEALAKLTKLFFTGHGPAVMQDFVWWSGLTTTEAKAGLEMVKSTLQKEELDGQTYWFANSPSVAFKKPLVHLLPNYDEYLVAYKNRPAYFDATEMTSISSREIAFANHLILLDGRLLGGWRRIPHANEIEVETNYIRALDAQQQAALQSAIERFSRFMELPITVSVAKK